MSTGGKEMPVESVPKAEWMQGPGCSCGTQGNLGPCNEVHDVDLDDLEAMFPDDTEGRWRAFQYGFDRSDGDAPLMWKPSLLTTRVGLSSDELKQLHDILVAYEHAPVVDNQPSFE